MTFPKVSVIIPCYNQAQYLKDCLDSVIAQTFRDFEVIIVDDGSTDDSGSIAQEYVLRCPYIFLIHQKNEGVGAARNLGIKKAKGRYILPLDADDKITPCVLEKAVAILDKKVDVGIVGGQTEYFGVKSGRFQLPKYSFPEILVNNQLVCSCLFRRSDWEKVGGYNSNMVYGLEDWDFWLSLIELGRKVYQFDEIFLYYRQLEKSRSTELKKKRQKKMLEQIILNHPNLYSEHPELKDKLLGMYSLRYLFLKKCVHFLCLLIPVKSWRHKLRSYYKKG